MCKNISSLYLTFVLIAETAVDGKNFIRLFLSALNQIESI